MFNNGQWGAEKKNHVDFYSQPLHQGVESRQPELGRRSRRRWVRGHRGRQAGRRRRRAAAVACKRQAEGKTTVLEMMVTQELGDPFRRDALAKPVRHLSKYKDFV